MPKYTQSMFGDELERMIEEAKSRRKMPLIVTARKLHDRVIPSGEKNEEGKPVARWTSVCSAMRWRADIEKPVNGKRRGECLETKPSGNSSKVTYKYSS